jgi:hypothetical protein
VRKVGQIAAVHANGHDGSPTGDNTNVVPRRGLGII